MEPVIRTAPPLRYVGVSLRRGSRPILDGFDLELRDREICVLMGESGAGKTTALRAAAALESFDTGSIQVEGFTLDSGATPAESLLRPLRRHIGFVFQSHSLFGHLTALENVTLSPVHSGGKSVAEAARMATSLLESLGVAHRSDARPAELSGGEAQRVAIARALALDPVVLLMDEPTAALDPSRRSTLADLLKSLARDGRTLLVTTHDVSFARMVADRVAILAEGRIVECGDANAVFNDPQHPSTRDLLTT